MDRIKSAFEKAMERAEQLAPPTEEERLEWKWGPEGKRLAGAFMKSTADLVEEVEKVEQPARRYLLKGLIDVLVETLRIPQNEPALQSNERTLEALTQLMGAPMKEIAERIRYVCTQYLQYYPQQSQEAFEKLKPLWRREWKWIFLRCVVPGTLRFKFCGVSLCIIFYSHVIEAETASST